MTRLTALLVALLLAAPARAGGFEEDVTYQGRPLRDWLRDIRAGDPEKRLRASRVLRLVGPEADNANAALLLALKADFKPDDVLGVIRPRIGLALARLGPKQAPVLAAALGMEDEGLAFGAAWALAQLGPQGKPAARHLARQLASSAVPRNRILAALALWRVERRPAIEALAKELQGKDNDQIWAAWALEQLGPAAAPAAADVVSLLNHPEEMVRRYAFRALEGIGQPAVAPLVKALEAGPRRRRVEAIEALGRLGPDADDAIPALIDLAGRASPGTRAAAARALGRIGQADDKTLAALRKGLRDPERDVRQESARALRALGPRAAPAAADLGQALRDADRAVCLAAAAALVRIGKPAVAGLVELLADSDELLRRQALDCLRDIGPDAGAALSKFQAMAKDRNDYLRGRAVAALAALGKPAVAALTELLADDTLRPDAVVALARLGPEAAAARKALTDALAKADPALRAEIVRALGEVGAAAHESIPDLAKLYDEDDKVRLPILSALTRMPAAAKEWLAVARKALKDERPLVRLEALAALAAADAEAKPALEDIVACLKDDSSLVRQSAGQVLVLLGGKSVVPAVKEMLGSDDAAVRQVALELIVWLGPEAKELQAAVRERLEETKADMRLAAVAALCEMDATDDSGVSTLLEMSRDRGRRASRPALFRLLGRSRAAVKLAVPLLIDILDKEADWSVRVEAARALGAIGAEAKPATAALLKLLLDLERLPEMQTAVVHDLVVLGKAKEITLRRGQGLDEAELAPRVDAAVKAVSAEGLDAIDRIEEVLTQLRELHQGEVLAALVRLGPGIVPELTKDLTAELAERRKLGARALGALAAQAKDATAALRAACRDGDPEVAVEAARALLAVAGDKEAALPALRGGLEAPGATAIRAAEALETLGAAARPALPALLAAAGSRHAWLRRAAVRALAGCDGDVKEVRPVLERRLRDQSWAVRVEAALGLRRLAAVDPVALLGEALRDGDPPARLAALAAIEALGEKAKPALPALTAALEDRSPRVRTGAARAVKKLAPERDVSAVLLAVATASAVRADVRAAALRGLRGSVVGRARYAVADLAREPSVPDAVRAAAREAMAKEK